MLVMYVDCDSIQNRSDIMTLEPEPKLTFAGERVIRFYDIIEKWVVVVSGLTLAGTALQELSWSEERAILAGAVYGAEDELPDEWLPIEEEDP